MLKYVLSDNVFSLVYVSLCQGEMLVHSKVLSQKSRHFRNFNNIIHGGEYYFMWAQLVKFEALVNGF